MYVGSVPWSKVCPTARNSMQKHCASSYCVTVEVHVVCIAADSAEISR